MSALKEGTEEQFQSNHCENHASGKRVRPITDVISTALGKEEMTVHL
jgi:hypothetical protein